MDEADPQALRHGRRRDLDQFPLEEDLAAVGPDDAVDNVHQRRLSRPVLARNGVDLALAQFEIDRAQGLDRPKGLADLGEFEDEIVCHGGAHSSHSASMPPAWMKRLRAAPRLSRREPQFGSRPFM